MTTDTVYQASTAGPNIVFRLAGTDLGEGPEMLRIQPDGFYVRGAKVEEQGAEEALTVYKEFCQWLAYSRAQQTVPQA